jgi:hypothetical protein
MSVGGGTILWQLLLRQHALGQTDPLSGTALLNAVGVLIFYFVFMIGTLHFGMTAVVRTIYYFFRMLFLIVMGRNLRELAPNDAASVGIFSVLGACSLLLGLSAMYFTLQHWSFSIWGMISLAGAIFALGPALASGFVIRDVLKNGYRYDRKTMNTL